MYLGIHLFVFFAKELKFMSKLNHLLNEYNESHQNKTNKLIHWICVPLIMISLIGILYEIPFPDFSVLGVESWALVALVLAVFYYFFLTTSLGIAMLIILRIMLWIVEDFNKNTPISGLDPLFFWIGVFVLAWIGQFIGHKIEGKKPSFLKDLQFLLIGPLWLMSFVFKKLRIPY